MDVTPSVCARPRPFIAARGLSFCILHLPGGVIVHLARFPLHVARRPGSALHRHRPEASPSGLYAQERVLAGQTNLIEPHPRPAGDEYLFAVGEEAQPEAGPCPAVKGVDDALPRTGGTILFPIPVKRVAPVARAARPADSPAGTVLAPAIELLQ